MLKHKSIAAVLAIIASFAAARPTIAQSADSAKIAAISETLDRFHAAASKADEKAYFDLFAPDGVFIGTDAAERWPVEAFRKYVATRFAEGQGWTYRPRKRHVTLAPIPCGCVAWFDETLDNAVYGTARGSGVLSLTSTGWKIAQYVLSFPIPNPLAKELTEKIRTFEKR